MIQRLFRKMLLTQILSSMTVTLCMLIDSIVIGRFLGVDAMSAYGLASPPLLAFAAFGSLISTGVQVMCGKAVGRHDREGADACYSVSLFLAAVVSAAGFALILCFLDPFTVLLGAGTPGPDNPVFGLTRDYLVGVILGAPAFLLAQILVPYMQIAGRRKRLAAAVAAMTVSDVIFDFLSVFVFDGGTFGMGLASTLSYYVAIGVLIGYFFRKDCLFRFRPRLIRLRVAGELAACGAPTVVNQISVVLLVFLLNRLLLGVAGTPAVAAYAAISTVGNICFCFAAGVGSVAMLLGAAFFADRDRTSIRTLVKVMTRHAVLLDAAVTAAVLLAAPYLASLFLDPAESAGALAVTGLRLFALSLLPSSINSSFKNYYQGVNRLRLTELISALQNLVFPALFAFLFSRFWGVDGVWLGFAAGETAALLTFSVIVWVHAGRISFSADAYSMPGPGFGDGGERSFECTAGSAEEAEEASRRLGEYCRQNGIDRTKADGIALCAKEILTGIVLTGFSRDRRPHSADLRFVPEGTGGVLRIRDDCAAFDPTGYLSSGREEGAPEQTGKDPADGLFREAKYTHSLGLNHLTLVI